MSWITTQSGKHFDFNNISPDAICIEDIACALSNLCRFTGHVQDFYSVAQHSVHVSYLVPPTFALDALLHDAAEAYIGDCVSPLKALLPDYQEIEKRVELAVAKRFGIRTLGKWPEVKRADLIMLATERRDLDLDDGTPWPILEGVEPAPFLLSPLNPRQSRVLFLQRYNDLKGNHHG
ncbi:HD family hydrolase [Pantoea agglomerans]|uniref:HD family hydrolase n=1 Tax=Enterobacter agglomerans TaxID=549 RepID=UPI001CCD8426|nr:HD family hydrolase [Pantoea agglomerans]UBN55277.1 HD family hydrolase [Pantoea agglomerans]